MNEKVALDAVVNSSQQADMTDKVAELANMANDLAQKAYELGVNVTDLDIHAPVSTGFFMTGFTVFVLACFVGYHVVWKVTPALHSPLMGITNAISSVIIVGAIIALGANGDGAGEASGFAHFVSFLAVTLASVNIFGGFVITRRMLHMFRKKG